MSFFSSAGENGNLEKQRFNEPVKDVLFEKCRCRLTGSKPQVGHFRQ